MVVMKDPRGYLTKEECDRILSVMDDRDKTLIYVLLHTGRRISEVVGKNGVTLNDINDRDNLIRWRILKRGDSVEIIINTHPKVISSLIGYAKSRELSSDEPIFDFTRQRAFQIIRKAGKLSGVEYVGEKKIHPHHFRHTFAINKAKQIKDISDLHLLQKVLGHATMESASHYLTYSSKKMKKFVEGEDI